MLKFRWLFFTFLFSLFTFSVSYAADEMLPQDFFAEVLAAIGKFGGMPWVGKVALIVTILISSFKVSFLNKYLWGWLGAAKPWVGMVLGLIGGILSLSFSGELSVAGVFAYMSAGAGAIILHELLDSLKSVPGIGPMWVGLISLVQGTLKGPATKPPAK